MHNVEQHYAVVGVLEDLNKTLTVLEHYVPRFFKGALNTYWSKLSFFRFLLNLKLRSCDLKLNCNFSLIDILLLL